MKQTCRVITKFCFWVTKFWPLDEIRRFDGKDFKNRKHSNSLIKFGGDIK
jgi:hypothetical protein